MLKVESKIWLKVFPLGRIGTPDDIVKAVLFLTSDDAAFLPEKYLMSTVENLWIE
jgi:NAD(P)-dependent dehydrogenase (short-subunit alcohol dehydrogenase family)